MGRKSARELPRRSRWRILISWSCRNARTDRGSRSGVRALIAPRPRRSWAVSGRSASREMSRRSTSEEANSSGPQVSRTASSCGRRCGSSQPEQPRVVQRGLSERGTSSASSASTVGDAIMRMSGWVVCGGIAAALTLSRARGVFGVYGRSAGKWSPFRGTRVCKYFLVRPFVECDSC